MLAGTQSGEEFSVRTRGSVQVLMVSVLATGCGAGAATSAAPQPSIPAPASTSASPPAARHAPDSPTPRPNAAAPAGLSGVSPMPRSAALSLAGLPAGGSGPAVRFTDTNGRNVVVLSVRGSGRTVTLTADHVLVAANGTRRVLRHVQDGVSACDFDVTAGFLPGSLKVADRNADGLGEVTFAYDTACRSDVSPATLKLLVLQNGSKYILRGETDMSFAGGPTPAPPTAEPAPARWLAGTYRPALERFGDYQRTAERL